MTEPRWERSFSEPHAKLDCRCGWTGHDDAIVDWNIEPARDRVVRRCPDCGEAVPEWGTLQPIEGVAKIARGELRAALAESDAVDVM
ncbi:MULTISPECIES: hypothetical protein [unclassified Haladaptatus]|uniref:hypothetical protein n=1 Tax=unclassified Haladaptatus TaxID=2622732 RepID=UPI0023E7A225|nr:MULTISPECIES: hypothetical protein [unclassified Haladaptatus]